MTKVDELLSLIQTKHPEWSKLSIRELVATSGYKFQVCNKTLTTLKTNPTSSSGKNSERKKQGATKKMPKAQSIPPLRNTADEPSPSAPLSFTADQLKGMSIKAKLKYLGEHAIDSYLLSGKEPRILPVAINLLAKDEFITSGQVTHGVYWTSEVKPYSRPDWLYPWQPLGIDLARKGHCMYLGSRQKPGKSLTFGLADVEDCIQNPGTIVSLFAPTQPLGRKLLRQMFKETIELKEVEEVDGKYKFNSTGRRFNLWEMFEPYILLDKIDEKVFKNGSRIQLVTLDYKSVQGIASDVVHIEEFDKVVRLSKEGGHTDKLEALAALLPQIRARPSAKIRITCNNASGMFRILRDRLYSLGTYFPIYMEVPTMGEFSGKHYVYNEDATPTKAPDVDDILKIVMDALMGAGYTKQQLYNVDDRTGELWNAEKVAKAYSKGKMVSQTRTKYPITIMSADPGAGHAYAFTVFARDHPECIHLWSKNFYSGDQFDPRYESKLHEIADIVSDIYCKYNCTLFTSESNSGAKLITPFIGAAVNRKLENDPRFNHQKSMAKWAVKFSNFGSESTEGLESTTVTPKNRFLITASFLFDYEWLTLQERNEDEQELHHDIVLYNPQETAEKYKGDQAEAMLHCLYWLVGGKDFLREVNQTKGREKVVFL